MKTITVCSKGSGDCLSISEAIEKALPYDLIRVTNGVYEESFSNLKPVAIIGEGLETIIRPKGKIGFQVVEHLMLKSLLIQGNGSSQQIINNNNGRLSVIDCCLEECHCAIMANGQDAILFLDNTIIRNCSDVGVRLNGGSKGIIQAAEFSSNKSAVIISDGSNPLIRKCRFRKNQVGTELFSLGESVIQESLYLENEYGITISDGANPVIRRCDIERNNIGVVFEQTGLGILEECHITSCNSGIYVSEGSNPILRTINISDSFEYGLIFNGNANGLVQGCTIDNCYIGILFTEKANPFIRHTQISNCNKYGLNAEKGSVGIVEECELFLCGKAGLYIETGSKTAIRHSRIHNNGIGCHVVNQGGAYLVGSQLTDNSIGVLIDKDSWFELVRSQVLHSEHQGIVLQGKSSGLVERSYICSNLGSGLEALDGSQPVIRESSISQNLGYAVSLENNSKAVIIGSYLKRNSQNSLNISSASEVISQNNETESVDQPIII